MEKSEETRAFLEELNGFLETFHPTDAAEVEWEKGDYGFKISFGSPGKEIHRPSSSDGKNKLTNDVVQVVSPVVGTFHFLEQEIHPGSPINANAPLGLVKSLNVDYKIESSVQGLLAEVHVREGQPVEFGQVLFTLEVLIVS